MKKISRYLINISLFTTIILFIVLILNLHVSYYQGINYKVNLIKVPLYAKIIDFYSRHYHYKELTGELIKSCKNDEEKVFALFEWTHKNIRKVPEGLPIVDDHVWNIIIRGYGTDDQACDVFTTLCNYAGVKAFFSFLFTPDKNKMIALSYVKISDKWHVFDPYNGIYFKDRKGGLASIEQIKDNEWILSEDSKEEKIEYAVFFKNLPKFENGGFGKANIQSPLNRLIFEVKKWGKHSN